MKCQEIKLSCTRVSSKYCTVFGYILHLRRFHLNYVGLFILNTSCLWYSHDSARPVSPSNVVLHPILTVTLFHISSALVFIILPEVHVVHFDLVLIPSVSSHFVCFSITKIQMILSVAAIKTCQLSHIVERTQCFRDCVFPSSGGKGVKAYTGCFTTLGHNCRR